MTPTQIGLTIAALCLGSLAVMFWLAFKAPLGWEDPETGFHLGEPHSDYDQED